MLRKLICFASVMLVVFCGCSDNDDNYDFISSDGFYRSEGELISELSQTEKDYLEGLFDDAEWKDGMLKYRYDYVFAISDTIVEYTPRRSFLR